MTTIDGARSATDEFLVKAGRFFTPGTVSSDLRTVTKTGGREATSSTGTDGVTTRSCAAPTA